MSTIALPGSHSPWRDLGSLLSRNRRSMLIAVVLTTTVFGAIALLIPPAYRSESVLMVRLGPEYLVNADPANTGAYQERREIQSSEIAMLTAPEVIAAVIKEIGLQRIYPSLAAEIDPTDPQSEHDAMEKALIKFSKHLTALPGKESTLLSVSYSNSDPEVAGTALHQLVLDYLQMRRKHFEYASGPALSAEVVAVRTRLDRATAKLDALRARTGITDFDMQMTHLFEEQGELSKIKDQALGDVSAFEAQIASLRESLEQVGESVPLQFTASESDAQKAVRVALAQLRLKADELHIAFKDSTPQMDDIRRQIGMAQSLLHTYGQDTNEVTTTGRPQSFDKIQSSLKETTALWAASKARLASTNAALVELDHGIAALDNNRALLHQLVREQKIAEDAFFQAGKRETEAVAHDQIMEGNKPNVEVVQAARVPFQETMTRTIIAAMGVVLGVIIALVLAYVDSMARSRQAVAG